MNFSHQLARSTAIERIGALVTYPLVIGLSILLLFSIGVLVLAIVPTGIWLAFNGVDPLFAKRVHTIAAPDSKHEISVSKRVHLPVFDLLDPPTTIAVELRNAESQEVLDEFRFEISDICHLNKPQVEWLEHNVRIGNVDAYVARDITLNFLDRPTDLR
jgi:hypothetical protein